MGCILKTNFVASTICYWNKLILVFLTSPLVLQRRIFFKMYWTILVFIIGSLNIKYNSAYSDKIPPGVPPQNYQVNYTYVMILQHWYIWHIAKHMLDVLSFIKQHVLTFPELQYYKWSICFWTIHRDINIHHTYSKLMNNQ